MSKLSPLKKKERLEMKGGSLLSSFWLVIYIILKYPIKYFILIMLFYMMIELLKQTYYFTCLSVNMIVEAFKIILEPGELDLIIFKIPDLFQLFMALKDLVVGIIYLSIALVFFLLLGLVSLPFNMLFPL